jgi:lysophospholipase L1-like esterase
MTGRSWQSSGRPMRSCRRRPQAKRGSSSWAIPSPKAGTNDIAENTGKQTLEEIGNNIASMSELARANGIRVVLCSVLPASDFPWHKGLEPAPKIRALNAWMKDYAAKNGFVYVDYYAPMANSEGGLKAELSPDGVHPNKAGYDLMGPLAEAGIAEALKKPLP